jgi:7-cyano-7-deazaguanine synthase
MFSYGQTHSRELHAASNIANYYRMGKPTRLGVDLTKFDSALVQSEYRPNTVTRAVEERRLPPSFVPGRNAIMICMAAGFGYGFYGSCIYGGWNAVDYSGYPDCRPVFLDKIEEAISLALDTQINLMAPLLTLSKAEIIKLGMKLKAPLHLTWSCYKGEDKPCETCDSCKIRAKGFKEAACDDPALQDL